VTAARRRLQSAALRLFAEKGVTRVNVSELAEAAGVARGTVYNNLPDPDELFAEVAAQLSADLNAQIAGSFRNIKDPAQRLANGIRYFMRRAHEDPHWGRFLCRFGLSTRALQQIWIGQPVKDLLDGLEGGRYVFQREQLVSVVSLITGTVLGAVLLVLEGRKTWRDAGSDAAELVLGAIGVPRGEARELARAELPVLPDSAP
jgi:AcrR family transcriptional regulator